MLATRALILFFISGMSGLIYEIVWIRRLGLTLGHSTLAISTVVAAYMGGLALGSYLTGRAISTGRKSRIADLHLYGWLELFIGAWGLISFWLLGAVERVYLHLAHQGWSGQPLALVAFGLTVVVLLPPTTAMGATLPILSRALARQGSVGIQISRLYASNTLGAVVGSALAGFVLLPWLGSQVSLWLNATFNLGVGWVALLTRVEAESETTRHSGSPAGRPGLLALTFAMAGFASLLLQICWTRALAVLLGSSVYAFSAILVAFLTGIGLGSSFYSLLMKHRQPHIHYLSHLYALTGLTALASLIWLPQLPPFFVWAFPYLKDSFEGLLAFQVFLCCLVLLLPTLAMGLGFPLVTHLHCLDPRQLGRSVGTIYSANTLGCILGSFAGGFLFLPHWGLERSIQLAVAIYLVCALLASRRAWPWVLASLGLGFLSPGWDTALAADGTVISISRRNPSEPSPKPFPPYFYKDGLSCAVAFLVTGPTQVSMNVNGKSDASWGLADRMTMTWAGLIPLFYVDKPEKAVVIGLGSGLTITALAQSPSLTKIVCSELEPVVLEVQKFWEPFNERVTRDPRVTVEIADGRTQLMSSSDTYDLIVSEPSNPWIAGIANLYTQDFYRTCRERLSQRGCFVQWCNLYAFSPADLDIVIRTFYSEFPHGDIWTTGPDLLMVGSKAPLQARIDRLRPLTPWVAQELHDQGLTELEEMAGQFFCSREKALEKVGPGPLNRDNLPILEYSAPRSLYSSTSFHENVARCLSWYARELPQGWPQDSRHRTAAWYGARRAPYRESMEVPEEAGDLISLLQGKPREPLKLSLRDHWELAQRAMDANLPDRVLLHTRDPQMRAEALFRLQRWDEAIPLYHELVKQREVWWHTSQLASCYYLMGKLPEASGWARRSLELNPLDPRSLIILAEAEASLELARKAVQVCPSTPNAWALLARLEAQAGKSSQAARTLQQALEYFPGDERFKKQLGELRR